MGRLMMGLYVVLAGCAGQAAELVPVECDGDTVVCDGVAVCDGADAYVVCGRSGPYCRAFEGYVDAPVDAEPVCVR